MNLDENILLVQTAGSALWPSTQTGRALWTTQAGPEPSACTEAAANDKFVVVINGSMFYVLDIHDGRILWTRQLGGVPGSGPGLSHTHAFVPMVSGLMEGYDLEKGAKQSPVDLQIGGPGADPAHDHAPIGQLDDGEGIFLRRRPSGHGIRFRLETRNAIHSRPGYWTPNLYACSTDGYVYAIDESRAGSSGDSPRATRFTSPVAIEGKIYVVSEINGLYCLDGASGERQWHGAKIVQFVSASPTRVYGIDWLGRLAILDGRSGANLGAMKLEGISQVFANGQSDRIYLASDSGNVQCLREAQLRKPVLHVPPPPPEPEDPSKKKAPPIKSPDKSKPADEAAGEPEARGRAGDGR